MMGTPAEEVDTFKTGREILVPACWKTRQPGRVIGKRGEVDDYHLHPQVRMVHTYIHTPYITNADGLHL